MSFSRVLVWLAVLSCDRGGFLSVSAATGSSASPTCTTDAGRCWKNDGGCQRVNQGSEECRLPLSIDNNPPSGCADACTLPTPPARICGEAEPEEIFTDLPVDVTYSVHNNQQFNVTASWMNDLGGWTFTMMLTDMADRQLIRCTCGSTNQLMSAVLTNYFGETYRNIHLCLRNGSGSVRYLKRSFFSGEGPGDRCESFVTKHNLDARLCRESLGPGSIGQVSNFESRVVSSSELNVSWQSSRSLDSLSLNQVLYVYDITYHVTLVGVQDHHIEAAREVHNFNVSNSTSITVGGLRPGWNYTVTVRTSVWCESDSCRANKSGSVTMPDLPTTTLSTTTLSTATVNLTSQPAETTTGVVTSSTTSTSTATVLPYTIATVVLLAIILLLAAIIITVTLFCHKKKQVHISAKRPCHLSNISTVTINNSESIESDSTPHVETMSRSSSQFETSIPMDYISYGATCGSSPREVPSSVEILVVGSMRNPILEHVQNVLQPLMSYLSEEIKVHMYNVKLPGGDIEQRGTPSMWVEQVLTRVHYIVCICNREFFEDWNYNEEMPCYDASLVKSLRLHFSRLANYSQAGRISSSFVIGLVQEEDFKYVPESLKHCTPYVLDSEESFERLAGFLSGTPAVEVRRY